MFIGTFPLILLWALFNRQGMRERLGFLPSKVVTRFRGKGTVWIHAASVGEVGIVATLVPELKRTRPDWAVVVSTMTTTGYQRAKRLIKEADLVFYAPLDLPPIIRRILNNLAPTVLLLTETELWPNLILEAKRFGTRIALINGRLSPRSSRRYRLIKGLMGQVLAHFDLLCVQTPEDRDRMVSLGADHWTVLVTGNLKFDLVQFLHQDVAPDRVRDSFYLADSSRVLVAGSTRPGEEEVVLDAYLEARDRLNNLVLVLAPRHLNRVREVEQLLVKKGLAFHRRTSSPRGSPMDQGVLLLDTIGELSMVYGMADLAFVGGSLLPFGGHNPLEPAAYGVPVLFGPYMDHTRESAELLLKSGGGIAVKGAKDLADHVVRILQDPWERKWRGEAALRVVTNGCGVAARTVKYLVTWGII